MEQANVDEIRKALRDIRLTLEPLVIGPPATAMPVMKARYMLSMLDTQLTKDGLWWQTATRRADEWQTEQTKKAGKK